MLNEDRPEFETQLKILFAGCGVAATPERLDAYWTGLHKMALTDVVRVIEHHLAQEGETKVLKPGQFWQIARQVKARRMPDTAVVVQPQEWAGDVWDRRSNQHLHAFITERAAHRIYFCSEAVSSGRLTVSQSARDPETCDLIAVLLEHKRYWAEEMREFAAEGAAPIDMGKAQWLERMGYALEACRVIKSRYAAARAAA